MADAATPRKLGAGVMPAALRQGAKELATALKPFPESISVDEPGQMFTPTQGEIAEANRSGSLMGRVQEARDRATQTKETPEKDMTRD